MVLEVDPRLCLGLADLSSCPLPVLLPGSTPSKTLPLKTSWVNLGLWSFWSVTMMEMFMGSSTEAPFSDTAWPKSCGCTGPGSAWPHPPHLATGPCFCWMLQITYLILRNLLPVQRLIQQQPACFLLYGEDTLRGAVCSRACDAVENLGASVLIRFELEAQENSSWQSDKSLTTANKSEEGWSLIRNCSQYRSFQEQETL